jgi:hypothetical protein
VLATVALAGPAAAQTQSIHWGKAQRIERAVNGGITAIACASAQLCVAGDQSGYILTSTQPTASKHPWSGTVKVDTQSGGAITGLSCPAVNLCVAVDANGNVLTSTAPAGGAKAWSKPFRVDSSSAIGGGYAGLVGISCPTTTLCVAVDGADPANIVTSTNPTGGSGAWKLTKIGGLLAGVSCSSSTLCVITGSEHYYAISPTGGTAAWHATGAQIGGGIFSAIACPSATTCVNVGYGNSSSALATSTTTPKGASTSWLETSLEPTPANPGEGLADGVACLDGSFCVAVDSLDNVYTTNAPGRGIWSVQTDVAPASSPTALGSSIACTSTLCVVVDSNGYAVAGTKRS